MKKLLALILGIVMVVTVGTLVACNNDNGNDDGELTSTLVSDITISDQSLTVDLEGHNLYVTSIGQSGDETTLKSILGKFGFVDAAEATEETTADTFTSSNTLTANQVEAGDTVMIVGGASSKGMGAAGINAAGEIARAQAFAARNDINIIFLVLGNGNTRRGETSDAIAAAICPKAKVSLVMTTADYDGKFSRVWCPEGTVYGYSRATRMEDSIKFILGV